MGKEQGFTLLPWAHSASCLHVSGPCLHGGFSKTSPRNRHKLLKGRASVISIFVSHTLKVCTGFNGTSASCSLNYLNRTPTCRLSGKLPLTFRAFAFSFTPTSDYVARLHHSVPGHCKKNTPSFAQCLGPRAHSCRGSLYSSARSFTEFPKSRSRFSIPPCLCTDRMSSNVLSLLLCLDSSSSLQAPTPIFPP